MALGDNNPAASSTPAGDTMSVPRSVSGGRTRNVINVAQPGSEGTVAYTMAYNAPLGDPTGAGAGYRNFHSQRYLHCVVDNSMDKNWNFKIWGYSSFAGVWAPIGRPAWDQTALVNVGDGDRTYQVASGKTGYVVLEVDGIERVAVSSHNVNSATEGTCVVYLGVNTF